MESGCADAITTVTSPMASHSADGLAQRKIGPMTIRDFLSDFELTAVTLLAQVTSQRPAYTPRIHSDE